MGRMKEGFIYVEPEYFTENIFMESLCNLNLIRMVTLEALWGIDLK